MQALLRKLESEAGLTATAGPDSPRPPPKKEPAAGLEPPVLPSLSSFIRCSAADILGAEAPALPAE